MAMERGVSIRSMPQLILNETAAPSHSHFHFNGVLIKFHINWTVTVHYRFAPAVEHRA